MYIIVYPRGLSNATEVKLCGKSTLFSPQHSFRADFPFTLFVVFKSKSIPFVEMMETDPTFFGWSPFNRATNWNLITSSNYFLYQKTLFSKHCILVPNTLPYIFFHTLRNAPAWHESLHTETHHTGYIYLLYALLCIPLIDRYIAYEKNSRCKQFLHLKRYVSSSLLYAIARQLRLILHWYVHYILDIPCNYRRIKLFSLPSLTPTSSYLFDLLYHIFLFPSTSGASNEDFISHN